MVQSGKVSCELTHIHDSTPKSHIALSPLALKRRAILFNGLFAGPTELLFLAFPILISLVVGGIYFFVEDFGPQKTYPLWRSSVFFLDILLIGFVHTVLTMWILFQNKETKEWVLNRNIRTGNSFWMKIAAMAMALFAIFAIAKGFLPTTVSIQNFTAALSILFITILIPFHHSLYQMRGISLLYAQKAATQGGGSPETGKLLYQNRRREKALYNLFFFALIVPLLFQYAHDFQIISGFSDVLPVLRHGSIGALVAILLAIFANQASAPTGWDIHRSLFSARLSLFILIPLSPFAYLAIAAVHGVEYGFICKKLMPPEARKSKFAISIATLASLLLFAVVLRAGRLFLNIAEDSRSEISTLLFLAGTFSYVVQYLHVHIDTEIFSMKHPETAKFARRLIE